MIMNITKKQAEQIVANVVKIGNYMKKEYSDYNGGIIWGFKINDNFTLYVEKNGESHITQSRGYAESWHFPIINAKETMQAFLSKSYGKTEAERIAYYQFQDYMRVLYELLTKWQDIKADMSSKYKSYIAENETFLNTLDNFRI